MTFFVRVCLIGAFVMSSVLLVGCSNQVVSPRGTTTTLVVLRHAERIQFTDALSDEGRARAAALPVALEGIPIDAIYSPDRQRNLDTVAPLAGERGLPVRVIGIADIAERMVSENPGKTVVWVGNTDNLDNVFKDIGAEGDPPVIYGELFVVRLSDSGLPEVTKLHFGK